MSEVWCERPTTEHETIYRLSRLFSLIKSTVP